MEDISYEEYMLYIKDFCMDILGSDVTPSNYSNSDIIKSNDSYWLDYCAYHDDWTDFSDELWIQRIYVPIIFTLILVFGGIGNVLVIFVTVKQCSFKCVTNMYVLSLAVADLVFLTLCVPFTATVFIASWPFGEGMCKLTNYLTVVTMATSVMTLTAMSVDRYNAVVRPVESKLYRTPTRTAMLLVLIWIVNFCSLVPVLTISKLLEIPLKDEPTWMCIEVIETWWLRRAYTLAICLLYYALPLGIISLFYSLMAQSLWHSISPSLAKNNLARALAYRKKVAKMMLVIVGVFIICISPLHVVRLVIEFKPPLLTRAFIHIKVITHCLAYMNCAINPIIYAFMSTDFRNSFKEAFPFCCKRQPTTQMTEFQDLEALPRNMIEGITLTTRSAAREYQDYLLKEKTERRELADEIQCTFN